MRGNRQRQVSSFLTDAVTYSRFLAEAVGFEPTVGLPPRRFSRPVHSTTLPRLPRPGCVTRRGAGGKGRSPAVTGLERGAWTSGALLLTSGKWSARVPVRFDLVAIRGYRVGAHVLA